MPDKMRYFHCCSTVEEALFKPAPGSPASSTDVPQELGTGPGPGTDAEAPSPHCHLHMGIATLTGVDLPLSGHVPHSFWGCFNFATPCQELQLSSNITRCNFCPAWPRHVLRFKVFWAGIGGTFAYYQLLKFFFSFPPNKYFSKPT